MTKSEKQSLVLKLMVIALNKAISAGRIDLDGGAGDTRMGEPATMEMTIAGKPSVFSWFDSGHGELRLSVWWDYQPELMPTWRKDHMHPVAGTSTPVVPRRFFYLILGACGSCYLERKSGKFIIGSEGNQLFDVYVREDTALDIDILRREKPLGYAVAGEV